MYNTSFFKKILLIATVAVFYSCDKDFNALGDDIIGDNHFGLEPELYDVKAYNQKVTPVASNNLAINALGIYDNPVFGVTTANFNTQVSLPSSSYGASLGDGAVIDSVTLYIPYFHHRDPVQSSTTGGTAYILDSIYGPVSGKIKLSVYESGIFLNTYNANNYDISKFYNTNRNSDFQDKVIGERLNNSTNIAENDAFFFNSKEIILTTPKTESAEKTINRATPGMRLHLNKNFFKTKIFDAPAGKLASDDVFRNYFKGLYFKVEKSSGSPTTNMAMIDFGKEGSAITIFYKAKTAITTDAETVMESKTLVINLYGNTASLLQESNPVPNYATAIAAANDETEDEKLYLKGGQGSMAVIELSQFESQLADIRKNVTDKKWMVNEANLIFYVDETEMSKAGDAVPERVYLYDATNNTPIRDYFTDGTTIGGVPKRNKYIFDGMIQKVTKDNNPNTTYKAYKVRITDHIRNILKNNTVENVKLGLVVTESIAISTSNKLDPTGVNNSNFQQIPTASVMSPLGTVLFGGTAASGDKRVKLQVYYTKPNL